MPLDDLPGEIIVPTRDEQIARWKRDHRILRPDTDPADPQLDVDARVATDSLMPVHAASKTVGNNCVLEQSTGILAISKWGARYGVDGPNPAIGASGYVSIVASTGGTPIEDGDELIYEATGNSYKCVASATYFDGDHAPIVGVDTGPNTNLDGGVVLKWKSPRPGCGATATVVAQLDGTGLTGGREAETPLEYRERIRAEIKNKPASGNDADYQSTSAKTPDVSILQVFTWPAILGTGTTAVAAILKPARPGGSRVWNDAQRAEVESFVVGQMPADDGAFFVQVLEESVTVVYRVTWDQDAAGWADLTPWPPYYAYATNPGAVVVGPATSTPTSFQLISASGSYTNVAQPAIGTTIGFFNQTLGQFVRKTIATVSGSGPWTVTVDTTKNASDQSYAPILSQRAMPWSDSLNAMLPPLLAYMDSTGPGEMVSTFYDDGRRQRRQPEAPKNWPYALTEKGLNAALDITEVADGGVVEGAGIAAAVGAPGSLAMILKLSDAAIFPE